MRMLRKASKRTLISCSIATTSMSSPNTTHNNNTHTNNTNHNNNTTKISPSPSQNSQKHEKCPKPFRTE